MLTFVLSSIVRIGGMTAMLKVVSTRCLEKCVREAQQIMGGLGYARGGKGGRVEAISRDVRVMAVGEFPTYLPTYLHFPTQLSSYFDVSSRRRGEGIYNVHGIEY